MTRHRISLLLTVFAVGLAAPPALAQAAPGAAPAADTADDGARRLFAEGTAELNAGKAASAETKLRAAWQIKKSYDVAGNLGAALLELGRHAEAAQLLAYAADNLPAGGKPSVKKWVLDLLRQARSEVCAVRVRVSLDGAQVRVNGEGAGTSPLAHGRYVPPGALVVEVSKEGFEPHREVQRCAAGSESELTVTLAAKEPRRVPVVTTTRGAWPLYVLGGTGAAALVAGGVLIGAAHAPEDEIRGLSRSIQARGGTCPGDPRCDDLARRASASDTMSRAGVGLLVGGAALSAAAGLYWFWPSLRGSPSAVGVVPVASSDGGGLVASGRF